MNNQLETGALSLLIRCIELNYPKMTLQDFSEIKEALLKTYLHVCIQKYGSSLEAISILVCDVSKLKEKAFSDDE